MIQRKIQEYVSFMMGTLESERRDKFKTTTIMILKRSFMRTVILKNNFRAIMTIKNEKG